MIPDKIIAKIEEFNQKLDHANHLSDIRNTLRFKIEDRIAFLQLTHNSPHDGSTSAWLKRMDEESQVVSLMWVLEEIKNAKIE